jgi:hypothetical protein
MAVQSLLDVVFMGMAALVVAAGLVCAIFRSIG